MHRFRLPPQILRLVLLTAVIVASYVVARALLTPATFGQYGHYRGAALEQIAQATPVFAGAVACNECHEETRDVLVKYEHKTVSCEACHGPSRPHVRDPDVTTRKLSDGTCLRCHSEDATRPKLIKQVKRDHFEGDKCIECHLPHQPKEEPKEKTP